MAIKETELLIGISSVVVSHYEKLGYEIPRIPNKNGKLVFVRGSKIKVKVEDLPLGSRVMVTKICDDCGKVTPNQKYCDITKQRRCSADGKDRCFDCGKIIGGNSLVKRFVNDKNCISNVDKEFAKLFWNKQDTIDYTCNSNRKADFKCPNCENKITRTIAKVYSRGLSCNRCSDGVSYPEKFVSNVLHQLNVIFENQKSFKWIVDRKYDFYIDSLNLIIETHGKQHFTGGFESYTNGRTLVEEQDNDVTKMITAMNNGMDYVVIDTSLSELEYIKTSIENSRLSTIFDLSKVDWDECHMYSCKSIVKEVCDKFNAGIVDTEKLAKIMCINRSTVQRYLNKGTQIGLCNYDGKAIRREVSRVVAKEIGKRNGKPVIQLSKDGDFISEHKSITSAISILGLNKTSKTNISLACKETWRTAYGYKWMFKEDYDKTLVALA